MKRWAWRCVKLGILALVLVGIGRFIQKAYREYEVEQERLALALEEIGTRWSMAERGLMENPGIASQLSEEWKRLDQEKQAALHIDWRWLGLGCVFSEIGLWSWGRYWVLILRKAGHNVPMLWGMHYYFLGHLGKYVPGKAMVFVLRGGKLLDHQVPIAHSVLSIFLETLVVMASGAAIGGIAWAFHRGNTWLAWGAIAMGLAGVVTTLPGVMRWLLTKIASRRRFKSIHDFVERVDGRLIAQGWVHAVLGWLLMTLSLHCVLHSLPTHHVTSVDTFEWIAVLLSAATLSVVAGFLALIPGGAGIREYVLMVSLGGAMGYGPSLLATLLMRAISILAEMVGFGVSWLVAGPKKENASYNKKSS